MSKTSESVEKLTAVSATRTAMPLFYRTPEVVTQERHGGLGLRRGGDYKFAAKTNSVPITLAEFLQVSRFYPMVFIGQDFYPVAVLGLQTSNQFVDAEGQWEKSHYVPAYMRRYPFVFVARPNNEGFVLGIDASSDRLVAKTDGETIQPLFAGKLPTDTTQEALRFCGAYQMDHAATVEFSKALVEQDLLVQNQAQAMLPGGQLFNVQGFRVVDQARFQALPEVVVVDWHRKGWLALVHFHLASLDRWNSLLEHEAATAKSAA